MSKKELSLSIHSTFYAAVECLKVGYHFDRKTEWHFRTRHSPLSTVAKKNATLNSKVELRIVSVTRIGRWKLEGPERVNGDRYILTPCSHKSVASQDLFTKVRSRIRIHYFASCGWLTSQWARLRISNSLSLQKPFKSSFPIGSSHTEVLSHSWERRHSKKKEPSYLKREREEGGRKRGERVSEVIHGGRRQRTVVGRDSNMGSCGGVLSIGGDLHPDRARYQPRRKGKFWARKLEL